MIIKLIPNNRMVGGPRAGEQQCSRTRDHEAKIQQGDLPRERTRVVCVPNSDGTLIPCYATLIDESEQTARLLWAPNPGPFSEGDLIQYAWLPGCSIPVVAIQIDPN